MKRHNLLGFEGERRLGRKAMTLCPKNAGNPLRKARSRVFRSAPYHIREKATVFLLVSIAVIIWIWLRTVSLQWWAELSLNDFCYLILTYSFVLWLGRHKGFLTKRFLHVNRFAEIFIIIASIIALTGLALEPAIYLTPAYAASVAMDTSTSNYSLKLGGDRKTLYDGAYYWVFYYDGSDVIYEKSSDGTTWSGSKTTVLSGGGSRGFGVWEDGTYVWVAAYTGSPGYVSERRVSISDGSLGAQRNINVGSGCEYLPQIIKDDSGYLWLKTENNGANTKTSYYATRSTNTNDDTAWQSTTQLDTDRDFYGHEMLVPMNSGKIMALYGSSNTIQYKIYNAGWCCACEAASAFFNSSSSDWGNLHYFSAVADSSANVHLIFLTEDSPSTSSHLHYTYYNGSSWSSPIDVDTTGNLKYPTLSIDTDNNNLYAFWLDGTSIKYKKKASSGWDTTSTTFQSSLTSPIQVSSSYSDNSGIGVIWQEGSSSPYSVRFDHLCLCPSAVWTYPLSGTSSLSAPSMDPADGNVFIGTSAFVDSLTTASGTQRPGFPNNITCKVQSRAPVASANGTRTAFAGACDGCVYAINASTGKTIWSTNVAGAGNEVRGGIAGQFNVQNGEDYLFLGTYKPFSATTNKVYALYMTSDNSKTPGNTVWSSPADSMDVVDSTPAVDTKNNRVYIASKSNRNTQPSLWAINTTDGSVVWSKSLGDITSSPTVVQGNIYVGTDAGNLYKFDSDGNQKWAYPLGSKIQGFPWVQGNKIYVPTACCGIYKLTDGASSATQDWNQNAICSPSSLLVSNGLGKLYVGSSNGRLYSVSLSDGSLGSKSYYCGQPTTVGNPALDTAKSYVVVGTCSDKKIHAVSTSAF